MTRRLPSPLHEVDDVVGGVRMHGLVSTPADAVTALPLVFVHGLGVSTRYLEPTMRRMALAGHPVAGVDLPGFGRSTRPAQLLGVTELAGFLAAWLDERRIGPAVFVANSFGCQVVVELALREPARALGLVLNAPTMDPAHRSALVMIARVALDVPREPLSLAWLVTRDYLRAGPRRVLGTLRRAIADRIEEKLPHLGMPVAIVAGGRDPVITVAWAEEAARLAGISCAGAAGATLHVVPTAAHALPYDDPAALAGCVDALLARCAAVAAS